MLLTATRATRGEPARATQGSVKLDFGQRYLGTFSADLNAITGAWEKRLPGADWAVDFAFNYRRVAAPGS
jgi:hypothetical protein